MSEKGETAERPPLTAEQVVLVYERVGAECRLQPSRVAAVIAAFTRHHARLRAELAGGPVAPAGGASTHAGGTH